MLAGSDGSAYGQAERRWLGNRPQEGARDKIKSPRYTLVLSPAPPPTSAFSWITSETTGAEDQAFTTPGPSWVLRNLTIAAILYSMENKKV